jgi:hypothetical protein
MASGRNFKLQSGISCVYGSYGIVGVAVEVFLRCTYKGFAFEEVLFAGARQTHYQGQEHC